MTRILQKRGESSRWTLFVDPGSNSAGWALFDGTALHSHGTWKAKGKDPFARLAQMRLQIVGSVSENLVEAHIETLNYKTSYVCIWSVGVIGEALTSAGAKVFQDVWIKSWQTHANWAEVKHAWAEHGCKSEDEWAAVKMGEWWHASRD